MHSTSNANSLTAEDYLSLYRNIFYQELLAIISSKEYKSRGATFTNEDRNKIKKNIKEIADIAAKYFIDNGGANLNSEKDVDKLFVKSIRFALK